MEFLFCSFGTLQLCAYKINHDLTLQFGLLSSECKDENNFIEKSIQLLNELKNYDKIDLDDMFFRNPPQVNDFRIAQAKNIG